MRSSALRAAPILTRLRFRRPAAPPHPIVINERRPGAGEEEVWTLVTIEPKQVDMVTDRASSVLLRPMPSVVSAGAPLLLPVGSLPTPAGLGLTWSPVKVTRQTARDGNR